jgi:protein O-mannosyl-transferase
MKSVANKPAENLPATRSAPAGRGIDLAGGIRRTVLPGLLLVILGLVAYKSSFQGVFVLDDTASIGNPAVKNFDVTKFRPARWLPDFTYAINYAMSANRPGSYHGLNLAIHLLSALVLFGLLRRTLRLPAMGGRFEQSASMLALASAAIWVVHPLTTQAVTYITQRDESLMALMYLLTIYGVLRWRTGGQFWPDLPLTRASHANGSPVGIAWAVVAAVACAAGMATKPVMVTVPAVVVLYQWCFLGGSLWRNIKASWWLVAIMVLLAAGAAVMTQQSMTVAAGFDSRLFTRTQYALTELGVICRYLQLSLWPAGLRLDYAWPKATQASQIVPPAIVVAVLLAAIVWAMLKGRRPVAFLGMWFFVILSPTSSIVPINDPIFEHRMYLPLMAVVVLVVVGGYSVALALWQKRASWPDARRHFHIAAGALAIVVAGVLTIATHQRNGVYHSERSIWEDVVAKQPTNARALTNLGYALDAAGQSDDAIRLYQEALKYRQDYSDTYNNLGAAVASQGKIDQAIGYYRKAIEVREPLPFPGAHNNLGNAYVTKAASLQGPPREALLDQALAEFRIAVDGAPDKAECHVNLANLLYQMKQLDAARTHYERAIALGIQNADVHNSLAVILIRKGQLELARKHLSRALLLNPGHPGAQANMKIISNLR